MFIIVYNDGGDGNCMQPPWHDFWIMILSQMELCVCVQTGSIIWYFSNESDESGCSSSDKNVERKNFKSFDLFAR